MKRSGLTRMRVAYARLVTDDPLAQVAELEGVGMAAAHARDSIDALLRHPAMRRDAARVAAESAVRGARASAELEGADPEDLADPVVQGALRVVGEVPGLAAIWDQAPRQALARMHMLAARDLVEDDALGRPRSGADAERVAQILTLATAPTEAPAVVVAALVHAEIASVRPFGSADGVVARAAERVILVSRGVDTKAVSVPEVGHHALARGYGPSLNAYVSGEADGVGAWVRHCADGYARGAEEGLAIAGGALD